MSTFIERRQRVDDPDSVLLFAEISATSFVDTLRIVNDTQNWISNGVEYIGFPFTLKLPDDVSGQTPRAQLVIDNVGRGMTDDLERLQPNELVMARILISDRANPDAIFRTLYLPMTQVSVNASTATAQCGVDYLMRGAAVRLVANPYTLPGAF